MLSSHETPFAQRLTLPAGLLIQRWLQIESFNPEPGTDAKSGGPRPYIGFQRDPCQRVWQVKKIDS
jgi:hypothetical protein